MSSIQALFVDLRRTTVEVWPVGDFFIAYIVTGTLEQTQDFFKNHHVSLKAIPHITAEITHPETRHLLTRIPSLTRLSLPTDLIEAGLSDHFALDGVITWDHRRKIDFYTAQITKGLQLGVTHFSIYGLQDFSVWQSLQIFLNGQGLFFYDRFHAAKPGHESPYQNHLAQFGDILAYGGWSRVTEHDITRTKGPDQTAWHTLSPKEQHEERLILGLSSRQGLPLSLFAPNQIQQAQILHLGIIKDSRLCPTDKGLWHSAQLVAAVS